MKLYGSLTSPFVRACRMAAIEAGLDNRIEFVGTVVKPTHPNMNYGEAVNPLRRVPALETDDGKAIIDSRVIIEYLSGLGARALIPSDADLRIDCLNRHAVASGATEALVLAMYENKIRPEPLRWAAWTEDQMDKARAAFRWLDKAYTPDRTGAFDLGDIAAVCLAGYAAFRFPEIQWLKESPRLRMTLEHWADRRSVAETEPRE